MRDAQFEAACQKSLLTFGFRLITVIGSGAFGQVWEAEQIAPSRGQGGGRNRGGGASFGDMADDDGEEGAGGGVAGSVSGRGAINTGRVAIKIVDEAPSLARFARNPNMADNKTAQSEYVMRHRQDIRKEVDNFKKLRGNPNIVAVISSGSFPSPRSPEPNFCECHFIVMELMRDSLQLMVESKAKLNAVSVVDKVRLALDAVRATYYAHTQNVAHRDIKPANLMIAQSAQLAIKMGDFGISVDYDVTAIRPDAVAAGTLLYMAPELLHAHKVQMDDEGQSSPYKVANLIGWKQADVYSLGITLYQLFTGELPYSDGDSLAVRKYTVENLKFKRLINLQSVPRRVTQTIEDMFTKKPKDRIKLEEAIRNLERSLGECYVDERGEEMWGFNDKVARLVRTSLKKKIMGVVDGIFKELSPPVAAEQDWYLNVLLRPTQNPDDVAARMSSVLCPVFGAHFVGQELKHADDWDQSSALVEKTVNIADSCCGLPIQLMQDEARAQLEQDGLMGTGNVKCVRWKDPSKHEIRDDVVSLVRIVKVYQERFGDADHQNSVVALIYKTDREDRQHHEFGPLRGNGWTYKPVNGEPGHIHEMSQRIQTEIIVPIYGPSRRKEHRSSEDICGVLNIEWVWAAEVADLVGIETFLINKLHKEKIFPISEFLSEIVSIVTTLKY